MSLTSSMWTSVSGLLVHGEKMGVIGNNIANINTVGFKSARMDFQDFMSQSIGTAAGTGQVGRGASIGIIMNNYTQGPVEKASDATDIAITGNGFFSVRPRNDSSLFYTRAGNFRFDKDGYLVDPNRNVLQGWKIDNTNRSLQASSGGTAAGSSGLKGSGVPTDIRMDTFTCEPRHTSQFLLAVNLDSAEGYDKNVNPDNPFFSLLTAWDATPDAKGDIIPLASGTYADPKSIEVYDEGGQAHKLTVYFDRVTQTNTTNIDNLKSSEVVWEFIVTMDPSEDLRNFTDNAVSPLPEKYKGLLMAGTLTFGKDGQIRDMTAYVPTTNDMGDLSTWVQAPLSSNGYPMITPNFSGREGASSGWDITKTPPEMNRNADGFMIEMDLGIHCRSPQWDPALPETISEWMKLINTGGYESVYKTVKDKSRKTQYYQKSVRTTAPDDYPKTLGLPGLPAIPTWQAYKAVIPGEVVDADSGLIYMQKKASQGLKKNEAFGMVGTPEANYVFKQANGSTTDGVAGSLYYDKADPTKQFVYGSDGKYYPYPGVAGDVGKTIDELKAAGVEPLAQPQQANGTTASGHTGLVVYAGAGSSAATLNNQYVLDPNDNKYYPYPGAVGDTGKTAAELAADGVVVKNYYEPIGTSEPSNTPVPKFILDANGAPIQATETSQYPGMSANAAVENTRTTSFPSKKGAGAQFGEYARRQDGYSYGDLRSIAVSRDGVLTASYSNGQSLELFQITLYDFPSKQNLRREGGNLFSETLESGMSTSGAAGTGGFGVTSGNSLEQSNVDLSEEFVQMITTQKGFQANSKNITTVDTMLDTVINMKR